MATITPTTEQVAGLDVIRVTWAGVATGDTCEPYAGVVSPDRSVQVEGTLGGSTVTFKGRLSPDAGYLPLTDPQGNEIAMGTESIEAITELVHELRPEVTGGTASGLNIYMLVRKAGN